MGIAEAAIAALGQQHALARLGQIGDQGFPIFLVDLGAGRNLEHGIGAAGAMHVAAHAGLAVLGIDVLLIAVVDQRVEIVHGLGPDIAAASAIAAPGAAEFDIFLAPEGNAAIAARTGADLDLGDIEELHGVVFPSGCGSAPELFALQ